MGIQFLIYLVSGEVRIIEPPSVTPLF